MNSSEKTIVTTRAGKIQGIYKDSVYIFKGIPYAAPPVGEMRWLPPEPIKPWKGVRPAQAYGNIPPQNLPPASFISGLEVPQAQGEDCLFLNIWSPGLDDTRRPVLFWIHGGAFNIGSGSNPTYHGRRLAKNGNVVVVTINYRLGSLGFLNLNEVTGGRITSTGNEGLLDQIVAFQWVRDNIAAFGGDPDNITAFGESAGGMSIGCLLAMPQARGLFHKAILESGVANTAVPLEHAVNVSKEYLDILDTNAKDIRALRTLTVAQILTAQQKLLTKPQAPGSSLRMTATVPVIDGKIIPEQPIEAVRKGSAAKIPLLVGTNLEECRFFGMMDPNLPVLDEAGLVQRCECFMPAEKVPDLIKTYREVRARLGATTTPTETFIAIDTDHMFRIPAIQLIEAQQQHNQHVYNYLFTWESPILGGKLGACHALEVGFVFGNYDDTFCGSGPAADRLSRNIQDAWVAFAHSSDPSCDSLGKWPPYGGARKTMILGKDCHVTEAPGETERCAWELVYKKDGK